MISVLTQKFDPDEIRVSCATATKCMLQIGGAMQLARAPDLSSAH